MTTKNRYVFTSTLEGFINVGEPSGKFNSCCFSFRLTPEVLEQAEQDREELLEWVNTKADPRRTALNPAKWDEERLVKYSFDGETGRARPVFVDTNGDPVPLEVLKGVYRGTRVKLAVQQVPYTKPARGTTLKVLGVQIVELATGNGAVDSGSLTVADVVDMFGKSDGYKASDPAPRRAEDKEEVTADSYDF